MRNPVIAILAVVAATIAGGALAAPNSGGLSAVSKSKSSPDAAFQEGVEALKAGKNDIAEKKFGEVLAVAPTHPEANYYMGLAKIRQGEAKGAIRNFEKAVKERPSFVEAREQLALARIALGDADGAREQRAAIEKLGDDCAASADCDEAYVARLGAAVAKIDAAIEPPADPAAAVIEEQPAADDASSDDGAANQQTSLLFAPREEGVSSYADAVRLINQQRYREAIIDLEKAQGVIGPHADILNYLGYAHRKLGLMDDAERYYRAALSLDPAHLGASEYLGELYLEIGDVPAARRQLARLDQLCAFGCAEREDLARLIERREGAIASN